MSEVKMETFVVELRERDGQKRTAPLLVMAVDQVAAQGWAEAHAEGNGLDLVAGATSVPDIAAWAKTHDSRDLVAMRAEEKRAAAELRATAKP